MSKSSSNKPPAELAADATPMLQSDREAALAAERRAIWSRRLRHFFIASVALHVIFFASLAISPEARTFVFGDDETTRDRFDARASEVKAAMQKLLEIQENRLRQSLERLSSLRTQLDRAQREELERLRQADATREVMIEEGVWPTPEDPDPTAEFKPNVDIDPPPVEMAEIELDPLDDMELLERVVELYRMHQPLEENAGRLFERFRALQLSEHPEDPIPLSQSLEVTRLRLPDRRDIEVSKLDMTIDNIRDGRYDAFRKELTDTYLEAQSMVNTARRWLELVRALEAELAGQFGEQYDTTPPPVDYYGHYLDPRRLQRISLEQVIDPPVELGMKIAEGDDGDYPGEWISLNRWYYVGPFTHPGADRRLEELDRTYPPEAGVHRNQRPDLDAVYEGRDGRELRWKYRRVDATFLEDGLRFEPYVVDNSEWAIWYFYTEIHSDRDRDVLASFASDDFGVCWLNGRRVWQSPPDMQPWVPFTAHNFRVIPLREGINRLLFKLENGPGTTAFSVILMTYEDRELQRGIPTGP